jgi:hypothetical protein
LNPFLKGGRDKVGRAPIRVTLNEEHINLYTMLLKCKIADVSESFYLEKNFPV